LRRAARALDAKPVFQPLRQPLACEFAVAHLGALIANDDPCHRSEAFEQPGPLTGPKGHGISDVECELYPGVGCIGVLPTWSTAGAEPPLQLLRGYHQAAANP
jgi:hypothetical protein